MIRLKAPSDFEEWVNFPGFMREHKQSRFHNSGFLEFYCLYQDEMLAHYITQGQEQEPSISSSPCDDICNRFFKIWSILLEVASEYIQEVEQSDIYKNSAFMQKTFEYSRTRIAERVEQFPFGDDVGKLSWIDSPMQMLPHIVSLHYLVASLEAI